MANVGTQNLLVQSDDMAVPHKGISLSFRRTYNAQGSYDVNRADGTNVALYGNHWTNTFDAHLAVNAGNQYGTGITVFDIDGARYDYLPDANHIYQPPPGQHALLQSDGGCGIYWIKKNRTFYYFWHPAIGAICGAQYTAYAGRNLTIYAPNTQNYIQFFYFFDNGDAGPTGRVNQIIARSESGQQANLLFADFSGHRLLSTLQQPDGSTDQYFYDASGNLTEVDHPQNSGGVGCAGATNPCDPQYYGYYGGSPGGEIMLWAAGARWMTSGGAQGGYVWFGLYNWVGSTPAIASISHFGVMNPVVPDGYSGSPPQPGVSQAAFAYRTVSLDQSGTNLTWHDTDGHQTVYTYDSSGRVTQRQDNTGTQLLTKTQGWDAQNDLVFDTDARGNRTDYAYDATGNAIAVAQPSAATDRGTFRPTALYSYDTFNNVVAYCDPVFTHSLGRDWSSNPGQSDSLCPVQGGATVFAFQYPSYAPYGELSQITAPLGYHHTFAYDPTAQGGADYGLPTSVTGDSYTQIDGTTRVPKQTFVYDANGNLTQYDKGNGAWRLTYDANNRNTVVTDPDSYSSFRYYYVDGSLSRTETPDQHANNAGVSFTYDLNGNVATETHHHGCIAGQACTVGVTNKWYDGAPPD